jgi:manganese/zinc/iron transport system permease protein
VIFSDYTVRTVALGSAMLGAYGGLLGAFALLRRQSLLGDAVSHAALPGIALAFLLTGSRDLRLLLLGAAAAGLLASWFLGVVAGAPQWGHGGRIKQDTGLGLILSVFFGFGLVLLTLIQKRPDANQAGLDRFLFGQASALLASEVMLIAVPAVLSLVLVLLFWKEFALVSFDRDSAAVLGLPVRWLELLLTAMTVVAVVVGLQTVGVVLVSALLVAPPAAARQWTDRLPVMAALSAVLGAAGGAAGTVLSAQVPRMPTGPTVVLVLGAITLVSLLLAPQRGIAWVRWRRGRARGRLRREAVLADFLLLTRQHEGFDHPHEEAVLKTMRPGGIGLGKMLLGLEHDGLVRRSGGRRWSLTESGHRTAVAQESSRAGETP